MKNDKYLVPKKYIRIEVSNRSHIIAEQVVGHADNYIQVAACRSRAQAERLIALLNRYEGV